jgi:hypothetical protein
VGGPLITIEGVAYPNVLIDSLELEEVVGRPGRMRARVEDLDGTLGGGYYVWGTLPDILVTEDNGDSLFRGQVVERTLDLEGVHRYVEFQAEDYNRLLARTLVGHEKTKQTEHPDGSVIWSDAFANTEAGGESSGIDNDLVQKFFEHYWTGPTLTFPAEYVIAHLDVDDPRMFFPMTTLDAVLERIASRVGTRLFYGICSDLHFHWGKADRPRTRYGEQAAEHTLARMLPESSTTPARTPHDISETPNFTTTIPARVRASVSTSNAFDGVYIRGGTTAASGLYTFGSNGGGRIYSDAAWTVYGSDLTAAGAMAFESDISGRLTCQVSITGYDGWRVGQEIRVASSVFGTPSARKFRIASVRMHFLPDGNRTYELELGNAPYRSFAIESTEDVPTTTPGARWLVEVEDVAPAPGQVQYPYAQIVDPSGIPYPIEGVKVNWSVNVNGTVYSGDDAADTAHMYYLDPVPTGAQGDGWRTDPTGRSYNALHAHADATADDVMFLIVEAPLGE